MRCLVLAGAVASRRSSSPIRGSCTGCSRRRPAGCGPRTDGGADPPVPARRLSGHRHRQRARRRSRSRTRSAQPGVAPRGALGRPVARRDVPALAVLPAAAVVDQAARPGRARDARVRALRLEQPARRGGRDARDPADADGRHVVLPVAPGDGGEPRRVRGPRPRSRSATTARWTGDAARSTARTARTGSRSRPTDGALHAAATLVMAVGVAEPYTPPGIGMEHAYHYADVRPAETYAGRRRAHHRQAELRVRAGQRPAPLGAPARAGVAVARQALGRHELAGRGPGALRPAVRGQRAGRRGVDPRRGDRPGRAPRRRGAGREPAADRRRRGHPRRGRRRSSRRPGSSRRCSTCRRSGWRPSGRARCRS